MAGDSPMTRRLGIAALCLIALAASVALAWWQWSRFESASGTFQNLGYVLQWPLFGLFPAFMVWRWRSLRRREEAQPPPEPQPPKLVTPSTPVVVEDGEDDEDGGELAAYNRFLAKLNARDQQQETR
jgi:DNA-binding transcriptional regulator of glucitol operon